MPDFAVTCLKHNGNQRIKEGNVLPQNEEDCENNDNKKALQVQGFWGIV